MKTITNNWQYLLAGLYTWSVTTFFGAILLDIVYSNIAVSALKPSETATMFSEAADFLLFIGTLTILAAIGAIGSSWRLGSVRNLFMTPLKELHVSSKKTARCIKWMRQSSVQ